ncbi:hypothetical protein GOODEAATRI_008416, partial [Goodea atripinnis]
PCARAAVGSVTSVRSTGSDCGCSSRSHSSFYPSNQRAGGWSRSCTVRERVTREEETREGHQQRQQQRMRRICRRPRHREIGHRLAEADGVTVLPASPPLPPGRPMTSDVTCVGAARGRL